MTIKATSVIGLLSIMMASAAACASDDVPGNAIDHARVADQVLNQSLAVDAGESVVIVAPPSQLDLLKALVVATAKAGGKPTAQITLPEARKGVLLETPLEHLAVGSRLDVIQVNAADAYIDVRAIADPGLFADVPAERFAALRRAKRPLAEAIAQARYRSVSVGQAGGIPTEALAEAVGADYQTLHAMFWRSMAVSADTLKGRAEAVADVLRLGGRLHLTSPHGTNLYLRPAGAKPGINTGRTADNVPITGPSSVRLPAGECFTCINAASAEGTVVVPRMRFRGSPVRDLYLELTDGELVAISAKKGGDRLKAYFAGVNDDAHRVSVIDIGVNPESRPLEGATYSSREMDGMVTLTLGRATWAGCDNQADAEFSVHVAGADLTLDTRPLVQEGRLAVSQP